MDSRGSGEKNAQTSAPARRTAATPACERCGCPQALCESQRRERDRDLPRHRRGLARAFGPCTAAASRARWAGASGALERASVRALPRSAPGVSRSGADPLTRRRAWPANRLMRRSQVRILPGGGWGDGADPPVPDHPQCSKRGSGSRLGADMGLARFRSRLSRSTIREASFSRWRPLRRRAEFQSSTPDGARPRRHHFCLVMAKAPLRLFFWRRPRGGDALSWAKRKGKT
jgi:hypothetical protein